MPLNEATAVERADIDAEPNGTVRVVLRIRTVSESNAHTHWRVRQRRAKAQREMAKWMVIAEVSRRPRPTEAVGLARVALPAAITLTRIAPRALDDDNLAGSQKHVRDGVADAIGVDDGNPRVRWSYAQRRGGPREYAVEVRIDGGGGGRTERGGDRGEP